MNPAKLAATTAPPNVSATRDCNIKDKSNIKKSLPSYSVDRFAQLEFKAKLKLAPVGPSD